MARTLLAALVSVVTVGSAWAQTTRAASPWELENKETWRFPASMKVVDVKQAFGAVGDGKTDDTAAMQKAFDQKNTFVYIPNGTYLVKDRLIWNGSANIGPSIQGESRDGVIIKLVEGAPGYGDAKKPKAVIQLVKDGKVSADQFKTKIRNLTIDAGGNKGAIGLVYYANNNGMCRNVRIVGQGAIGLDLSPVLNGPLLVSNVEIEGFDKGIVGGSGPFNSQTLEHVVLKGQKSYGVYNDGECLSIRGLYSTNACPAVYATGNTVLIDSELKGGESSVAAIVCGAQMFVRNVKTEGYGKAIEQRNHDRKTGMGDATASVPAGLVEEWVSGPPRTLFGKEPVKSLNLPIEEAPYEPLAPHDQWVCVDDFGANGQDKEDDTEAVKKAIAAVKGAKSVLCFSSGRYIVSGRIEIGGGIRRVQGAQTYIQPAQGQALEIMIGDGSAPVVLFDMIDRPLGRLQVTVNNASSRTLVLRNFRTALECSGAGKTFLEDACSHMNIANPKARVWARQLNSEGASDIYNTNAGGTLWVLGLKTERVGTVVATTAGGRTEILGGWIYVIGQEAPTRPMFSLVDSAASFAGVIQYHFAGKTYPVLVDETRKGQSKQLSKQGGMSLFSSQ
jgi:hypothetical protein